MLELVCHFIICFLIAICFLVFYVLSLTCLCVTECFRILFWFTYSVFVFLNMSPYVDFKVVILGNSLRVYDLQSLPFSLTRLFLFYEGKNKGLYQQVLKGHLQLQSLVIFMTVPSLASLLPILSSSSPLLSL